MITRDSIARHSSLPEIAVNSRRHELCSPFGAPKWHVNSASWQYHSTISETTHLIVLSKDKLSNLNH